jgi:glucosamine kinase
MPKPRKILVADSGSTKTDWKFIGPEKEMLVSSPGINPYYQDTFSIQQSLENEPDFKKLLTLEPTEIYFYGSGCSTIENQEIVRKALIHFFPEANIFVSHDLLAAARSLCGPSPGIACILGTGSNSCLFDGQNIVENLPNLGFWLGDEGSAGFLGKDLLVKWFHKEMPDNLWLKFKEKYQPQRDSFLDKVYHQPYPNRFMAGFAPFLSANISDPWCQDLVANAFRLFLTRFVLPYPNSKKLPIHFLGSIALHFENILVKELQSLGLSKGKIQGSTIDDLALYHTSIGF